MKLQILTTALVFAAITSAPAFAMISKQNLDSAINSAITSGTITSLVRGDTVTLFGNVDGNYEANQAKNAALNIDGVNKVINRISISN